MLRKQQGAYFWLTGWSAIAVPRYMSMDGFKVLWWFENQCRRKF
jgi:hypothetical protein